MTKSTLRKVSRRTVLKGAAAASAAAAVGPWVVSPKVLASSSEVNVLMWSEYLPAGFLKSFESKTGIINREKKARFTTIRDRFRGTDITLPTTVYLPYGSYTANKVPFSLSLTVPWAGGVT